MEKFQGFKVENVNSELEAYSRELYNEFINSSVYQECLDDGFTNEEIYNNIGLFTDLKISREKEALVKTYDDCLKYNIFYKLKIIRSGVGFDKVYDAIDPYKKYLRYISAFIFKDFSHEFDTIDINKLDNKEAIKKIVLRLNKTRYVYIQGVRKSGKSYISIAYVNAFIKKHPDKKVAYIDCSKRFNEINDLYFKDKADFYDVLNRLCAVDLLVLDNFGSEAKNAYLRDNLVMPLIKSRFEKDKLTIINSSYKISTIGKFYALKNEEVDKIVASELVELLKNNSEEIVISNISLY